MEVRWPFRQSKAVEDWEGREFVLYVPLLKEMKTDLNSSHLLNLLSIRVSTNTSPLLLVPPPSPPSLPLPTQALYTQLVFERLNVPGFSIVPSPLAAIFALGVTTGILLHISRTTSEISIIVDSVVRWECCVSVQVGQADCEAWFEGLLMGDEALDKELRLAAEVESWEGGRKGRLVKELAEVVFSECTGDDVEIPTARVGSSAFVVATLAPQEDEGTFDVAKK